MTAILTNFIHRLQLEQGYSLLADIDEDRMWLPDGDHWAKKLQEAAEQRNEAKIIATLRDHRHAIQKYQKTWKPVGGPFPCPKLGGEIHGTDLFAAPALLELKRHFSRILAKLTPKAIKVVPIAQDQVDGSVSREQLLEIGKRLQAQFDVKRDPAETTPLQGEQRPPAHSVVFDVIVLSDGVTRPTQHRWLEQLKVPRDPQTSVCVHCHLLDTSSKRFWTTLPRLALRERRNLAHALKYSHETALDIGQQLASAGLNLWPFAICTLFALGLWKAGHTALWYIAPPVSSSLWDILVPLAVLSVAVAIPRLTLNLEYQVYSFLLGYMAIYGVLEVWGNWPMTLGQYIALLVTVFCIGLFGHKIGEIAQHA